MSASQEIKQTSLGGLQEQRRPSLFAPRFLAVAGALAGVALGMALYLRSQHTVRVEINGLTFSHRTHARNPYAILQELRVALRPADQLDIPDDMALLRGEPIRVQISRDVRLLHDGKVTRLSTKAQRVGQVLEEAQVVLYPRDRLLLEGIPCLLETRLPSLLPSGYLSPATWVEQLRRPTLLLVQRAVPIVVHDGPVPVRFYTTALTVGEALLAQGVRIYEGDRVYPPLGARVSPHLTVYIERAKPVVVSYDGVRRLLRTRQNTVGALLDSLGVQLEGEDYVQPSADTPVSRDMSVQVVRVYDEYYVEETPIPYETRWEPDPEMEIDQRTVAQWGHEGALRRRVRVHYENGQEIHRTEEVEWVARQPEDRILRYGTKIVLRELETPEGTITYWRKLRMLATSYNAATAGKSPSHPTYGITRLGWKARKGIVAVDPRVIQLEQPMYVPGYGLAVAGDTGSAIKWRRIDLCYNDDDLVLWKKWVDVYLLPPVPPPDKINWVIPNWPVEKE